MHCYYKCSVAFPHGVVAGLQYMIVVFPDFYKSVKLESHWGHKAVPVSKTLYPLLNTHWFVLGKRPDMTENMLTGT